MGGTGSGNWYRWNSKSTEENFWRFDMASLKKHGVIGGSKWQSGNWQWLRNGEKCCSISYEIDTRNDPPWLRVHYTNTNSGEKYDYKIYLTTTQPHYGGTRWWFQCPVKGCGRRVSVLYLSHIFACRKCCDFTYTSQNESPAFRLLGQAQKMHQQLGGDGYVDIRPPKPKGMHWKTYWRKVEKMERIHHASLIDAARRFGVPV